ncbi:energy transducer TonB [Nannocystis pusilla]|uniref:Energy transducer TonB n=1 Tax=Nannocystis pusilla TaxID=889268 RepID=A0A9X3ES58_9BACT|nr:energy transducer TonB [Nannocystis pusilla]MCY1009332.1 energy transducer TonB [Nannocystis pusilla]
MRSLRSHLFTMIAVASACAPARHASTERPAAASPPPPSPPAEPLPIEPAPVASAPAESIAPEEAQLNALYSPQPDQRRLAEARVPEDREARVVLAYCVTTSGKTEAIEVQELGPNSERFVAACRHAVERWRFKPFMREGKAARVCTHARFNLKFL